MNSKFLIVLTFEVRIENNKKTNLQLFNQLKNIAEFATGGMGFVLQVLDGIIFSEDVSLLSFTLPILSM
jgi:hypothetical protein